MGALFSVLLSSHPGQRLFPSQWPQPWPFLTRAIITLVSSPSFPSTRPSIASRNCFLIWSCGVVGNFGHARGPSVVVSIVFRFSGFSFATSMLIDFHFNLTCSAVILFPRTDAIWSKVSPHSASWDSCSHQSHDLLHSFSDIWIFCLCSTQLGGYVSYSERFPLPLQIVFRIGYILGSLNCHLHFFYIWGHGMLWSGSSVMILAFSTFTPI